MTTPPADTLRQMAKDAADWYRWYQMDGYQVKADACEKGAQALELLADLVNSGVWEADYEWAKKAEAVLQETR